MRFRDLNKHILLTNGRSGSNFLRGVLLSHPQIMNYGEVLGEWTFYYKYFKKLNFFNNNIDYLDWILMSKGLFHFQQTYYQLSNVYKKFKKHDAIIPKSIHRVKNIGIKEFVTNFEKRNCLDYFLKNPDIQLIALVRNNHLQRYISWMSAEESGVWRSQKKVPVKKIKIDVDHMTDHLPVLENEKKQVEALYEKHTGHKMIIHFEDYFSSPSRMDKVNQELLSFLQVDYISVFCTQKQILPGKIRKKIVNYDEVESALRGTRFYGFLN